MDAWRDIRLKARECHRQALLKAKGVRTLGAQAHGYFSSAGFDQGFDVWKIVPGIIFKNETDPNVTSPQHELQEFQQEVPAP